MFSVRNRTVLVCLIAIVTAPASSSRIGKARPAAQGGRRPGGESDHVD